MICDNYICDLSVYFSGLSFLWSVVLVILVCGLYAHVFVMFVLLVCSIYNSGL